MQRLGGGAEAAFTWLDGERLVRFGAGTAGEAVELLAGRGFTGYALLTTDRAAAAAPALLDAAADVLHVPSGPVPDAAAAVRGGVRARPIVALGGGRVIDSAKAIAGADDLACAAVPTTLSGAPMTPFHRMPAGVDGFRLVRPAAVVADPVLSASQPMPALAASAMNGLAHAVESLYAPLANPVAEMAALRAARLFAQGLEADGEPDRESLGLAAVLAGYAVGSTGFAIHHAVCQTIVRELGTPHAETNAVLLPHSVGFVADRAPEAVGQLAEALSGPDAPARIGELAALSGASRLDDLGVREGDLDPVVGAVLAHPAIANTPGGAPGEDELRELLAGAL